MNKSTKRQFILIGISVVVSVIISLVLILSDDMTPVGATILALFQIPVYSTFLELFFLKQDIEDIRRSKTEIEHVLNEFAEINNIARNVIAVNLANDIKFDKSIKLSKSHKPFQLHLADMKYDYLTDYFKYNTDEKHPSISKIPRHYFEGFKKNGREISIWKWLVNQTENYKSIQILTSDTDEFYIENQERTNSETNFIITTFKDNKTKLKEFRKLFVIKDEWLSEDKNRIEEQKVKEHLKHWINTYETLSSVARRKFEIKFISLSEAKGATHTYIEDVGIFDSILGVQEPCNTELDLIKDKSNISFHFDKEKVNVYKNKFDTVFPKANSFTP